jgi:hypothetical protein
MCPHVGERALASPVDEDGPGHQDDYCKEGGANYQSDQDVGININIQKECQQEWHHPTAIEYGVSIKKERHF